MESKKRRKKLGNAAWKVLAVLTLVAAVAAGILAAPFLLIDVDEIPVVPVARVKPEPPPSDYAGSLTCVECHRDICEKYLSHPMNHAADGMPQQRPLETVTDKAIPEGGSIQYRVELRDKRLVHHEFLAKPDGEIVYDQAEPINYVIGSGKRGRTYLLERDGRFYESPIGWYASNDTWDFSPGYEYPTTDRFNRRVGIGCLYCHTGILNVNAEEPDTFRQPPIVEASISCERCHGPARKHVDYQRTGVLPPGETDPIVNPSKLDPMRREHVCYQCHLLGEAVIPRYGRTHLDFRPGMLLDDVWTVFVSKAGADSRGAAAVSHVEQMHASRCFQESQGRFGCTSCHDPHSTPAPEQQVTYFNQRCANCHNDSACKSPLETRLASPSGNSCIDCHMPKNPASDVAHTVQTDHRVLRDPTQAPLQPKTGITPLQDLVIFDSGDTRLPPEEVDRGKAILATNRPGATTIEQLDLKVQQLLFSGEGVTEAGTPDFSVIGDDVPALHALAFSLLLSHRAPEAIPIWERILEISPLDERALTQLLAHKQDESLEKMAQLTERLIESNPNHGLHWGRRTYVLGQLNRIDEAIRCAEKALKLNPQLLQVREWLVENYAKMGDLEKSSQHRKKLQEILELTKDLRKMEKNLPSAGGEVSAP